jgi:hypothetical protein
MGYLWTANIEKKMAHHRYYTFRILFKKEKSNGQLAQCILVKNKCLSIIFGRN